MTSSKKMLFYVWLLIHLLGHLPGANAYSADKILWDYWYTVTIGDSIRYGYYNERFETKKDRIYLHLSYWKNEEGHINEEHLGAYSENTPDLNPLFFNFRSVYRATETIIDGSSQDSRILSIKIKKGDQELPLIKKSLSKKAFLEGFFPVWLGYAVKGLKTGQHRTFLAIPESDPQGSFTPASGRITLEKPDELAKKLGAVKLGLSFRDMPSHWWIEKAGAALRVEIPSQRLVIKRSTKAEAEKFLSEQ